MKSALIVLTALPPRLLTVYDNDYLLISGLQHFVFCCRQWALIHIEQQWQENFLTAEGRVIHNRVHDIRIKDSRNGTLTIRGLNVKSDKLGITGTCDAVEFIPDGDGITLSGYKGLWKVRPVEYKHGGSKCGDCDRLQAAAQALCLEEMFSCQIDEAHIFYNKTRQREKFEISSELRERVKDMTSEMHDYYSRGYTPKVKPNKFCRSCSLSDLCLPDLLKAKNKSVKNYMLSHYRENEP